MSENGALQIEVGSRTDIGLVRENNEDSFRVVPALKLFMVSDGMGGEVHGELASRMAVESIVRFCQDASSDASTLYSGEQLPDLSPRTNRLASAVRLANRRIHEATLRDSRLRGMGATVVAAWLDGARLSLVHVGDSRAYLLRSGVLEGLTSDHTLVAEQVRRGIITPQQAQRSAMQSLLIRALGTQEEVELEAHEYLLLRGDVLVLCTDGLTRLVSDQEVAHTLLSIPRAQEAADGLVALANQSGGEDNVTVVVLSIR